MNLIEKLFEIQKTCVYLQKNAQGYQYKYASGTDVIAPIRVKMDELGVMLIPRVTSGRAERGEAVDDKGKAKIQFFTQVDIDFVWMDVTNPADTLIVPWYAQGVDPAEKGVGKAWTYAERYFLLKFFHIPTDNDDPDKFQERRVEAGKKRKVSQGAPPAPPPPLEEPGRAPGPLNEGVKYPPDLRNPWAGRLTRLSEPITGVTDGKPWTRWDVESHSLNASTFDRGVAECCQAAIDDDLDVEIVWKLKKSTKTGVEKVTIEGIRILEPELGA